ncbi:MAG: hypothetical protein WC028_27280 [Candidatus Obscuribacterales bacterium]
MPRRSQSRKTKLALALLSFAALPILWAQPTEARRDNLPEPPAIEAPVDILVTPPGEEIYFPVRPDGQPFLVNIDTTVNLTDKINGFYYDPKFRGEVWAPFDQVSLIERATRMMATWPEYDQFSILRKFNGVNKFFEKYSGFGP